MNEAYDTLKEKHLCVRSCGRYTDGGVHCALCAEKVAKWARARQARKTGKPVGKVRGSTVERRQQLKKALPLIAVAAKLTGPAGLPVFKAVEQFGLKCSASSFRDQLRRSNLTVPDCVIAYMKGSFRIIYAPFKADRQPS